MGFQGQCVQPDSDSLWIISPQGVFQGADASKMDPAKFDTLCKNLDVILDLVIRSLVQRMMRRRETWIIGLEYLSWSKQDKLTTNNHQYCGYREVVNRISDFCQRGENINRRTNNQLIRFWAAGIIQLNMLTAPGADIIPAKLILPHTWSFMVSSVGTTR